MASSNSPQTAPILFDSAFLARLEQIHLLAGRLVNGLAQAQRRSRRLGSNLEFADYRNYVAGDDLRGLDWNAFARLDRLFIKLFEEEQDLELHLFVDASASMRWQSGLPSPTNPGKFAAARRLAAALAYMSLAHLDRVRLHFFSSIESASTAFVRGKGKFHGLLEYLYQAPEATQNLAGTDLDRVMENFCRQTRRRGQVILIGDFLDAEGAEAPLKRLIHRRHDVALVQILDPWEREPDLTGDVKLHDVETGEEMDLTIDPSLATRYREALGAHNERLRALCLSLRIPCVQTGSEVPFEELVLNLLRKGGVAA